MPDEETKRPDEAPDEYWRWPHQNRAERLLEHLLQMEMGKLDDSDYVWDTSIDFREVTSPIARSVGQLINKRSKSVPSTPEQTRILAETEHLIAQRMTDAAAMKERIGTHMKPVLEFLDSLQKKRIKFPHSKRHLVARLNLLREILDNVEEMVTKPVDGDVTETEVDTESEDDTEVQRVRRNMD
ncbi:hypothetical protein DFH07DRAFT_793340 [Mycena maculata]|uniref:Uncharacterized protein n=1 Tax=Mycena maculata TaxID=230809 RepID=A0AAD7NY57_9AGAR|nr:hypothetical protein DFH07DRAFT_793340 [Mycena maculata]